ncbi:hypothetical protein NE237_013819 [Protea cynaroides]|uniref:Uncharacterized protein n=1 Tax=Protea cynaroides TaxID=273540 RepID=A0A9Q0GZE3_9MAGN|nr:hypothetical protein NE237_013819 [Protea cynaroides]
MLDEVGTTELKEGKDYVLSSWWLCSSIWSAKNESTFENYKLPSSVDCSRKLKYGGFLCTEDLQNVSTKENIILHHLLDFFETAFGSVEKTCISSLGGMLHPFLLSFCKVKVENENNS